MIILGVDPAISHIGWGVISSVGNQVKYIASGVIDTNPKDELHMRLAVISSAIEFIISEYKPDLVAMEEVFVNKNPLSSIKLSHARGAIMAMIGKASIKLEEFAPNRIKKTVVGAGKAEKEQVLHMVNILFPTAKIKKLDESDAIAIAYTGSVYCPNKNC